MPLRRVSVQTRATLCGHYEELLTGDSQDMADAGRLMIQLIERMSEEFRDVPIWGLTSLYHLKLLAADDWRSPWFVSIMLPLGGIVRIKYLLPAVECPWPDARVCGEARDVESALDMIRIAMKRSGGWAPLGA